MPSQVIWTWRWLAGFMAVFAGSAPLKTPNGARRVPFNGLDRLAFRHHIQTYRHTA
jgi:hypothetical protein